jgi:hypothetical protein
MHAGLYSTPLCNIAVSDIFTSCSPITGGAGYQLVVNGVGAQCTPAGAAATIPNIIPSDPYTVCCP